MTLRTREKDGGNGREMQSVLVERCVNVASFEVRHTALELGFEVRLPGFKSTIS